MAAGTLAFRLGFRLTALTLAVLALANPPSPGGGDPDLVILLDSSLSVDPRRAAQTWRDIADEAAELDPVSRARVHRFAADTVVVLEDVPSATLVERIPEAAVLDTGATDIEQALRGALGALSPSRESILVLATDGRQTEGRATPVLEAARRAGIPVLVADLSPAESPAGIAAVVAPRYAAAGSTIGIRVVVSGARLSGLRVEVEADGSPALSGALAPPAGESTADWWGALPVPAGGVVELGVRLLDGQGTLLDESSPAAFVNVRGAARLLYVSEGTTPLLQSLESGGWPVRRVRPDGLDGVADRLGDYPVIVLDDVDAGAARDTTWQALIDAVRGGGNGLLVLGGEHSFIAGSYRGSVLESVLPVTAEPPEPRSTAAVAFVIDASGSMGRPTSGTTYLQLARSAVLAAARTLRQGDETALIDFDVSPSLRLPMDSYRDPAAAISSAWREAASGGTSAATALEMAAQQLSRSDAEHRLLVLISDGMLDVDGARGLPEALTAADTVLHAWAVGEEADWSTLRSMASSTGGRLYRVTDPAQLPRFVREAVEQSRPSAETGAIGVVQLRELPGPFPAPAIWPPVDGYSLVRARPSSSVYLSTASGDPLLVGGWANAGEVLVFSPGLGKWSADWFPWPSWAEFAGALVGSVNPHRAAGDVLIEVDDLPGELRVRLHESPSAARQRDNRADVYVGRPGAGPARVSADLGAPGVLEAAIPATGPGRYDILSRRSGRSIRFAHARTAFAETRPGDHGAIAGWIESGLAQAWSPGVLERHRGSWQRGPLRGWLSGLALAVFLAGLAGERGLHRLLRSRIRRGVP